MTEFYVTDGNGVERSQEEQGLSAAFERAYEEGRAGLNDDGEAVFVDEEDVELQWNKLREPLLPVLYDFEVEPALAREMKPYRSGAMTQRSYYWKPTGLIKEELTKKLRREPEVEELAQALDKEHTYITRSEGGRKKEIAIAQIIYNKGITPFIGDEVWRKDGGKTQTEQTDIYAAGIPIECKSLYGLDIYSKSVDGELYVWVCSASSFNKKSDGLRYYVLSYRDVGSNIYLAQTYKLGYVCPTSPVVAPTGRIELLELEWEDRYRGTELGMFARATDLISFNSFLGELKKHRSEVSKTSRKLEDKEVVQLLYPHHDQEKLQQKLEQEQARLVKHQQDPLDF